MNVAITGHQSLGSDDTVRWVASAIEKITSNIPITKGYTCLAVGADQLFAEILIKQGAPFVAILACSMIASSFKSSEDKKSFQRLLALASSVIKLSFEDPSEEAYFEAGKTAVDKSELLIAVWDGRPAKGLGGTGDVVKYAHKNKKKVIHIDLVSRRVVEIDQAQV